MRALDWYAGVPLCYVLAWWERIRSLFPHRRGDIRNVLFIKFFGIGSIILSAPAVEAVRKEFPHARVHYLTFASNKEALSLLGLADNIYTIETRSFGAFVFSTIRTVLSLRRVGIDLAFDLEFFAKFPLVVATLIGAKRKAGFYLMFESWRKSLLDYLGYYNHYWHVKDIFLSLVYLVKTNDPYYLQFAEYAKRYTLPRVAPSIGAVEEVKKVLTVNGWNPGRTLILINPNAGKELAPELKRWPGEKWSALITRLLGEYPQALIVCTGTRAEAPFVESIISSVPLSLRQQVRNSAGVFTLSQLLALFSLANLFVTIDSGPMHLASLTKLPILGLFFAETPTLYGPLSTHAQVIFPKLYSLPSFTVYTGKDPLLPLSNTIAESVSVDEVFTLVQSLLTKASTS